MPDDPTAVVEAPESLGWRAGLPDDLKQNDTFKSFKTVGDFAKSHLETMAKLTDVEKKLEDYVPKLPDDATDEEKALYYEALGRPEKPDQYEFEGEDKNAPEWTNLWKGTFHSLGLTKDQAKKLSGAFNTQIQAMVKAHNEGLQKEMKDAEQKLRSEMGDKYDTNVELAKRMTTKHLGTEFDKTFENIPAEARFGVVRLLLKVAALTGEDRSPQGVNGGRVNGGTSTFINYDKSPAPPR